jgi:PEP-CTERM motif
VQVSFGFDGQIFVEEFDNARIGGHDFDPGTLDLRPLALFTLGDVFLSGDSTVTACQSANMPSPIAGSGNFGEGDTFTNFILRMPAGGEFCSTWVFSSDSGGFVFTEGKFDTGTAIVPEPSALGLMGSGLGGIVGVVLRKRGCRRRSN